MNKKKIAYVTVIITCLLTMSMVFQPHIKKVAAANGDVLIYDRISPSGDVYQDDDYLFGGTIFNNRSGETFRVTLLKVDFYNKLENGTILKTSVASENYPDDPRYVVAPFEAKTYYFQFAINLTIGLSYNLTILFYFKDVTSTVETPFERAMMDDNATINVIYKRPPSPAYIWAVLVLLTVGILAMVVVGIVGWVRDRRAKK